MVAAELPGDVTVVPARHHYLHPCTPDGIATLFEHHDDDIDDVYSIHLWAHVWWSRLRTDFTNFHAGDLTEEYVLTADTTYAELARRFLDMAP